MVRQAPRGKVATYGQIAQMIPPLAEIDLETYQAFSSRWVGSAMAAFLLSSRRPPPAAPPPTVWLLTARVNGLAHNGV